jgi:hypothetical protein
MSLTPDAPVPDESGRTLARTDVHDPVFPSTAEVLDDHDPEAAEEYAESVGVDPSPEQVGHYAEMVGDERLAEDSGVVEPTADGAVPPPDAPA